MLNIAVIPYRLYPDHGNSRSSNLHALQGWHIELSNPDTGAGGTGDALVWPQFGLSNDQVKDDLMHFEQQCLQLDATSMLTWAADATIVSAVRYAIELACFDYLARENRRPLAAELWDQHASTVTSHRLLGSVRQAERESGTITHAVKLKVGVHDLDEELNFIEAFGNRYPDTPIRLDANGAWTFEQAKRVCDRLNHFPRLVIEQPIEPRNLLGLDKLQELTDIPIALDESLVFDEMGALQTSCKQCVVKPMYMGGLRASQQVVKSVKTLGKSLCVTHVLESAVGRAGAVHFAAGVGDDGPHGVADPRESTTSISVANTHGHGVTR